jgi:NAD(P)-dependent dehydrogenase (short-subunit alcohol dehydrogenase family)
MPVSVLFHCMTTFLTMAPVTTKVALVTGAARGIGRAIALRLAEDGFDVAVNDLPNTPELNEVLREIENKGQRSLAIPADVSLEPDVLKMIQNVVEKLGSLDVVSSSF